MIAQKLPLMNVFRKASSEAYLELTELRECIPYPAELSKDHPITTMKVPRIIIELLRE